MRNVFLLGLVFCFSCVKKDCPAPLSNTTSLNLKEVPAIVSNVSTVSVLQNSSSIKDTYLSSYFSSSNYGSTPKLFCWAWTISFVPANGLFLLKFDYSHIPQGKIIESAKLSLFADTSNVFSGSPLPDKGHFGTNLAWSIRRIESDWDENLVTYVTKPSVTDYHKVSLGSPLSLTSSYLEIDVTDLVRDQLLTSNFGFEISFDNYAIYKRLAFYSSDCPYLNCVPKLEIKYK